MNEILFVDEEAEDSSYRASALGQTLHTEAAAWRSFTRRSATPCIAIAMRGKVRPFQLWSIFSRHNRTARSSSSTLDVTTPQTIS